MTENTVETMTRANPAPLSPAQENPAGGETCPCCGGADLHVFHRIARAPTNSCILLPTREEAQSYPTGEIALAHCRTCGFVYNKAFDERKTEYSGRYEETQSFSGTFNRFHRALAERLVEKHGLAGGSALEVGCGKGEFIALLAEIGDMQAVGVDPGVHAERLPPALRNNLSVHADFFRPEHIDRDFDLVACKMTIEHIPATFDFIQTIRDGIGDRRGTLVFFQAPEAMRILKTWAFEDVYYEHCNYFTAGSLARLFRRAQFDVTDLAVEYGEQYLTLEAAPALGPTPPSLDLEDDLDAIAGAVADFAAGVERTAGQWRARLGRAKEKGEKVVLWGSGSKAVAFLTAVDEAGAVQYVTDINPNRHGAFMPLSAQEILPPAALADLSPDLVIIMNRIYTDEITADLARLGCRPEIAAL